MAYKKYKKTDNDGLTAEDRALEKFSEIMIEKIKEMDKAKWKQPWFAVGIHPAKNLDGREYNDYNQVMLMFLQESLGWKTSRYATFNRIKDLAYATDKTGNKVRLKDENGNDIPDVMIKSGETHTPVFLSIKYAEDKENHNRIDFDDYVKLDKAEQEKYVLRSYFRVYNVYNIDQTNMKEVRPELYQKYVDDMQDKLPEKERKADLPEMDALLDKGLWVCPIRQEIGPDAYYSPSSDEIVLPSKELFYKDERFYGTALHEMAHSTGAKNRNDRLKGGIFGSPEYAREELVAELSSALLSSRMGFSKDVEDEIRDQSANYLKSWLGALQDDPKYIKYVLSDVRKASGFIDDRISLIGERLERDGENADFSDIIAEDRMKREELLHPEVVSSGECPFQGIDDGVTKKELREKTGRNGENALQTTVVLSPLIRQYEDFKRSRPSFTPLFHVSGGYETYQGDAERVAKVLDLPVRESAMHLGTDGHPAKYVSFPEREFEHHKQTLIDSNIILAVLEDMDKVEEKASDFSAPIKSQMHEEKEQQARSSSFRR